jgi:hypothetical protein
MIPDPPVPAMTFSGSPSIMKLSSNLPPGKLVSKEYGLLPVLHVVWATVPERVTSIERREVRIVQRDITGGWSRSSRRFRGSWCLRRAARATPCRGRRLGGADGPQCWWEAKEPGQRREVTRNRAVSGSRKAGACPLSGHDSSTICAAPEEDRFAKNGPVVDVKLVEAVSK